jgi:hypothetical protein
MESSVSFKVFPRRSDAIRGESPNMRQCPRSS